MLIQKSVRLPEELVVFIEEQSGSTFSEKLVSMLEELQSGYSERMELIRSHEQALKQLREKVDGYYRLVYDTRQASWRYENLLKELQKQIENLTD